MDTIIKQGEDILLEVRLERDGQPVELSTSNNTLFFDIKAALWVGTTELTQFSLNPTPPEDVLETHVTRTDTVLIPVRKANSKNYPIGILRVVVVVVWGDARFNPGRHEEFTVTIGKIIKGLGKDL
jgi:hypothetical protein